MCRPSATDRRVAHVSSTSGRRARGEPAFDGDERNRIGAFLFMKMRVLAQAVQGERDDNRVRI
jgi:hypothetical protein